MNNSNAGFQSRSLLKDFFFKIRIDLNKKPWNTNIPTKFTYTKNFTNIYIPKIYTKNNYLIKEPFINYTPNSLVPNKNTNNTIINKLETEISDLKYKVLTLSMINTFFVTYFYVTTIK